MNMSKNILASMLATTLLSSPAWAADKVGVIGAAGAAVTVVGADKQSRAAKTGDEIFLGDVVQTDGSGKAQLIFLDRSSITLKPNSNLTIDTFVYDPSTASGEMALKSAKGAFRFIGGALSKKKEVKLTTPVGTIGIRGGIADAEIGADGKTDAFFLYGEQLTFTNQNGEQTSTSQFGSGLALASATGTPQPVTPAQATAHFNNFRTAVNDAPLPGAPSAAAVDGSLNLGTDATAPLPAASGDNAAAPASTPTQSDGGQGPNDSGPNGTGGNGNTPPASGGSGNAQSGDAPNGDAPRTQQLAAADNAAPPASASASTTAPTTSAFAAALIAPRFDAGLTSTAGQTSADNAITNVVNSGAPLTGGQLSTGGQFGAVTPPAAVTAPLPPTGNVTPPAVPTPPPAATLAPPVAAIGTPPTPYTQFGRYIVKDAGLGNSTNVVEHGGILGNSDGSTGFDLIFNEAGLGGGMTTHHYNELGSVPGGVSFGYHTNTLGNNSDNIAYRSQSDSWRYYHTRDTVTDQQTAMIFGNALVSPVQNSLNPAIWDTRSFVNSAAGGSSHDVSFFNFMPSFGQYHQSATNTDPALLEYNLMSGATMMHFGGAPGTLPEAPLGMAVNWANKRFLTGFMQWQNTATPYGNLNNRPQLIFASGIVDPDGPTYLNGGAFAFSGVDDSTVLNTSMTASGLSDVAHGTVNARQQIFGSNARGVEGILLDQTAQGFDHATATLSTTNGSNVVHIYSANHGLAPGSNVRLSGLATSLDGIPAEELNKLHTGITVVDANTFLITTSTSAGSGIAGPSVTLWKPDKTIDSQLAVARTLTSSSTDNLMREDLARMATLDSTRTLIGFAGGMAIADHEVGGDNLVAIYTNSSANNVTVVQNKDAGTVNGYMNLNKVSTGDPDDGIMATFGGPSSFVGHRMWGVSQDIATFRDDAGNTAPGTNTRGALVAGTHIVDPVKTPICDKCDFVEWGVWAGESFNTGNGMIYAVNMVPVVVGEVTNTSSPGLTGTAVYNGKSYGTFYHNDTKMVTNSIGTMTATANLNNTTKYIDSLELTHNGVFGNNIQIRAGLAASAAPIPIDTVKATFNAAPGSTETLGAGPGAPPTKINGALFGPNGENIGGNFEFNSTYNSVGSGFIKGAGVFLGCQTSICP